MESTQSPRYVPQAAAGHQPQYAAHARPTVNGLAIAGMVLGLVGVGTLALAVIGTAAGQS